MKRPPIALAAVVLVASAAAILWRAWPPVSPDTLSGYIEGEPLYLAAPASGTVVRLAVERGDRVKPGVALFEIDPGAAAAQTRQAEAAARAAQARAEDAVKGQRPEELAVIRSQRASAAAVLDQARADYARVQVLARRGVYAEAKLDQARAEFRTAEAGYAEALQRLEVAELGARRDQARAAAEETERAKAAVTESEARQALLSPGAPVEARVEDIFFRPGEWAPANQPVLSLLSDERVRVRFFVPETKLAAYRAGREVRFACDGCKPQTATIAYVSPRAEFTPPVIYSRGNRERLVFLVEARPERPRELAPGQPVDVTPLEP